MQHITNTVLNEGYVNEHCLKTDSDSDKASLVLYFDKQACSNKQKRQQALSNLISKINELSGVRVATKKLSNEPIAYAGVRRQQRGILGCIKLEMC